MATGDAVNLPPAPRTHVDFATMTTLAVGGPAAYLFDVLTLEELGEALHFAATEELPVLPFGGGSNLLVADAGFGGVAVRMCDFRIAVERDGGRAFLRVGAGVEWDELVAFAVTEGYAGIECMSGIPGRVGAAPIQNIGAYGQEIGPRIRAVDVMEAASGKMATIRANDCGFAYRTSRFKQDWAGKVVVTAVTMELDLARDGVANYPELQRALDVNGPTERVPIAELRDAVLDLRRRKSMVWDARDRNRRSAGSFFLNPVVDAEALASLRERLDRLGLEGMPAYAQDDGRTKLSAAWLIERAGFERGFAFGKAGLSSRHTLAIVNRGDAKSADIIALAAMIRRTVQNTFSVALTPEPALVGFDDATRSLLGCS